MMAIIMLLLMTFLCGVFASDSNHKDYFKKQLDNCYAASENIQLKQCAKMNKWDILKGDSK
jgi:hypothetical protein